MSDDEDIQYVKRRRVVHFGAMDKEGVPERQEVSSDNMQVPTYIEDLFLMPSSKWPVPPNKTS